MRNFAWKSINRLLQSFDLALLRHHYYSPVVFSSDIRKPLDQKRPLPGLDFNVAQQLELLAQFRFREELLAIPLSAPSGKTFDFQNSTFGAGDAEMLYNMIRLFKPRRIVEIGCGQSTLMAILAEERNRSDDPDYACVHTCIEPFEQPWLEQIGATVIRKRIEDVGVAIVTDLSEGDILFIDSSHVIRPQGDVLHEYFSLIPVIRPGVLVHVHDVFTPRDYPEKWILTDRRLWNEQYLLEAFLSFNDSFEILAMVNHLAHEHRSAIEKACPILAGTAQCEPGSFWFRRRRPIAS